MDLHEAIRQLLIERKQVERAIAMLEELQNTHVGGSIPLLQKRRGRKSMGLEERRQVSARMRKYWANRRTPR